jgi:hypothetical protein
MECIVAVVVGQNQVKMIMVTSPGQTNTTSKSMTLVTANSSGTDASGKPITLSTSKPTQYITSTGQFVTIPSGLISAGQQPVSRVQLYCSSY